MKVALLGLFALMLVGCGNKEGDKDEGPRMKVVEVPCPAKTNNAIDAPLGGKCFGVVPVEE